jgi:hypothetical protein
VDISGDQEIDDGNERRHGRSKIVLESRFREGRMAAGNGCPHGSSFQCVSLPCFSFFGGHECKNHLTDLRERAPPPIPLRRRVLLIRAPGSGFVRRLTRHPARVSRGVVMREKPVKGNARSSPRRWGVLGRWALLINHKALVLSLGRGPFFVALNVLWFSEKPIPDWRSPNRVESRWL